MLALSTDTPLNPDAEIGGGASLSRSAPGLILDTEDCTEAPVGGKTGPCILGAF